MSNYEYGNEKDEEYVNSEKDYSTDSELPQNKGMFKHVFSFKGRIRRLEFGLSYLVYIVYALPMQIMDEYSISSTFATIWLVLFIPVMWFVFAQGAKRCHDLGHSGWWQLIPFYPLWMIFQDGVPGSNKYGNNPKECDS